MSVFGSSHVIVTDRLIGKRVHTGASQSPHLTTKSVRLYSLQCYLLLRDTIQIHLQPVSEKTPLVISTCPSVCSETLPHLCCVCVSAACVSCLLENGRELPERLLCVGQSSLLPPGIQMRPETLVGFSQG